jgi:hypothetical protein
MGSHLAGSLMPFERQVHNPAWGLDLLQRLQHGSQHGEMSLTIAGMPHGEAHRV